MKGKVDGNEQEAPEREEDSIYGYGSEDRSCKSSGEKRRETLGSCQFPHTAAVAKISSSPQQPFPFHTDNVPAPDRRVRISFIRPTDVSMSSTCVIRQQFLSAPSWA